MVDERKRTISFNEEFHRYTDEYNKTYTSVTTVISKYHEEFNREYWAEQKAKELGTTKEAILANWDGITKKACGDGNVEHKMLEDSVNSSKVIPLQEKIKLFSNGIIKADSKLDIELLASSPLALKYPEILFKLMEFIDAGYSIYVEKRIYWADFLIAGTIDCLLVKGKKFWIVDWKTNKDELQFRSGYFKKLHGIKTNQWVDKKSYFFKPINNIEYCKGNIYTLQLSLYAYLLELWGFECEGLLLYHLRNVEVGKYPNGDPIYQRKVFPYNLKYLRTACEFLTIDFKNASSGNKNNNGNSNQTILFGIT